jgi:hypothetical protein
MFLSFKLGRLDVLPELDLGIQNAIKRAYRKRKVTPKDVLRIGARWTPFATYASWYLWRSLDVQTPDGAARANAPSGAKKQAGRVTKPAARSAAKGVTKGVTKLTAKSKSAGGAPPTAKVRRAAKKRGTIPAQRGSSERG